MSDKKAFEEILASLRPEDIRQLVAASEERIARTIDEAKAEARVLKEALLSELVKRANNGGQS